MSETAVFLAAGVAALAVLYGIRLAARILSGHEAGAPATAAEDNAGVVVQPPFIYLGFLVAAVVLEVILPSPVDAVFHRTRYALGLMLAVTAVVIVFAAARRFRAAGTNIPPHLPTTALAVDGVYAHTRNPMYLAMTLLYAGLAIAAGSLWAIVLLALLLWVINAAVVAREEHYLERKFGDAYREYKTRVRRWV